jgi:hypothetical protein
MDDKGGIEDEEKVFEQPTLSMLDLGPIILNSDGTMSRVPNWAEMTAGERETAQRLIKKRNERRKRELLEVLESDVKDYLLDGSPSMIPGPPLGLAQDDAGGVGMLSLEDRQRK